MNVSPNDYNRKERRNSSWWSSRHRADSGGIGTLKKIRRLTLFDLVLLLVMMGVLLPLAIRMEGRVDAGPYKVRIDKHYRNEELTLLLKISLSSGSDAEAGETVGWSIYDDDGTLLHEEWDIAPLPGKRREFVFQGSSELSVRCEVLAGNENVEILIDRDR